MARIADYATLRQSVLRTLERENDEEAQDLFDEWVSLCESMFAPVLKAPWLTRQGDFTWGDNPTQRYEFLPPSFNGMITLLDMAGGRELTPINPTEIPDYNRPASYTYAPGRRGPLKVYCIIGFTIRIFPDPGTPGIPLSMIYYSRDEPLTAEENLNTTVIQDPNIYKYGTLVAAYMHYGETENQAKADAFFQRAISSNNELDAAWRRGAQARVRVRK